MKYISYEEIYQKFVEEKMTVPELAEYFKVSKPTIRSRLRLANVNYNPIKVSNKPAKCLGCGKEVKRNSNRQTYCEDCKIIGIRASDKKRMIIHKDKIKIQQATKFKYPHADKCSVCDSSNKVQHHHPYPYRVDVFIDLCDSCHRKVHQGVIKC